MKILFYLSTLILSLSSCIKYAEPTSLSLSGEYVIDKITYTEDENTTSPNDTTYYPGDLYINPHDKFPVDSIYVGFTKWHLDYSVISFSPIPLPSGQTHWSQQYFYNVVGHYNVYDLGHIQFDCGNGERTFKIISDGAESLVLRTTGLWIGGSSGYNQNVTLYLTRIGP
jgi:hypothetical protein